MQVYILTQGKTEQPEDSFNLGFYKQCAQDCLSLTAFPGYLWKNIELYEQHT